MRWLLGLVVLAGCGPATVADAGREAVDGGRGGTTDGAVRDSALRDVPRSDACGTATRYRDLDGDGYGDPTTATVVCITDRDGWIDRGNDCDDTDPAIHLGVIETCEGRDEDCDGRIDERDAFESCAWVHATNVRACRGGLCAVGECSRGWIDCDGIYGNGCERSVFDDDASCSGCDVACDAGEMCAAGRCTSDLRGVWAVALAGSDADRFTDVAVDAASGDVVVVGTAVTSTVTLAGTSLASTGGYSDVVVARFGADGTLRWAVRDPEPTYVSAGGVATDDVGNVYVAGGVLTPFPPLSALPELFVDSYGPLGEVRWRSRVGYSSYDAITGIAVHGNRLLVVGGDPTRWDGARTSSQLCTGTTDGAVPSCRFIRASLTDVTAVADGFVATGTTTESPLVVDGIELATGSARTGVVVHFDAAGVATWMVAIPSATADGQSVAEAVAAASDGGLWVAGWRGRPMYPEIAWLERLDATGALVGEQTWTPLVPDAVAAVGDDVLLAASSTGDLVVGTETLPWVGGDDGILFRASPTATEWVLRMGARAGSHVTRLVTSGTTRAYLLLEYAGRPMELGDASFPFDPSPTGVLWAVDL